jgi:hypothetical protein
MQKKLDAALQSMIENLKAKTGRSLEEWLKLTRESGLAKHGQLLAWLKKEHGVSHGYANLIAHETLQPGSAPGSRGGDAGGLVAAQYAGTKEPLRAIYDALAARVSAFGSDVELSPKKTYVSLRRAKQFGLIQPSTSTRVDVGLNLKGVEAKGRLEPSGSFNAMVTHRVRLASAKDVDAELIGWLRQAYEKA